VHRPPKEPIATRAATATVIAARPGASLFSTNVRSKKRSFPFSFHHTSGAIYCGVPQNVAVVCPNGTFILHKPKSTNLI